MAGAVLGSRLLVWAAALWAIVLFGVNRAVSGPLDPASLTSPFGPAAANLLVAPAARYDSVWYLAIAHWGYGSHQAMAFFPLYPLLIHAGTWVLGSPVVVGTLVSFSAMGAALVLLDRLARIELGAGAARTTVLLVAFFPTAFFLSAVYTESLFLALSVGTFYAARRERWALAAGLAALAGATRSSGVLLALPLVIMYFYGPRAGGRPVGVEVVAGARRRAMARLRPAGMRPRYRAGWNVAWIGLVPAGMAAYFAYLGLRHGTPFAPLSAEDYWHRAFAGPFGGAVRALRGLPHAVSVVLGGHQRVFALGAPVGWEAYQLIDVPYLAFAAAGLWFCWRRLPFAYSAYALVLLCQALSYPTPVEPMESFSRYLLLVFPVFMGWGAFLGERRVARGVTLGALSAGLVVLSGFWGVWAWVA